MCKGFLPSILEYKVLIENCNRHLLDIGYYLNIVVQFESLAYMLLSQDRIVERHNQLLGCIYHLEPFHRLVLGVVFEHR